MHKNNINNKVYIGQTKQKPEYRWKTNGKGYDCCIKMKRAIEKYSWSNFEHIILFKNLSLEESNYYEKMLIKLFNSNDDKYGYNISKGGKNCKLALSTKKKISELHRGDKHHLYGKHHTEETKKKIAETKNKSVLQFSLKGDFINEYKSVKVASLNLNFVDTTCISKVCNGKRKTAHGYIWKYKIK